MSGDHYTRFLTRGELRFRAFRNQGAPLPFTSGDSSLDADHVIKTLWRAGKAKQTLRQDDVLSIQDYSITPDGRTATMLLRRSDPRGFTQMVEHRKTSVIRTLDRDPLESITVSCHVFIDMKNKSSASLPTYNCLLEEVEGISRTHVVDFMSFLMGFQKYGYKDRHGKEKQTHSSAELLGYPSETMEKALKNSVINRVFLIKPGTLDGLDSSSVVASEEVLPLRIKNKDNIIETIKNIRRLATASGWRDVRVRVEMPEKKNRTVQIDREEHAANALFVRAEQIDLIKPLPSCSVKISTELLEKAQDVLFKKWNGR